MLTIIFKSNNAYKNNHTNPKQIFSLNCGNKYFRDFRTPNQINNHKVKYIITARNHNYYKKILTFFSLMCIRMNGKSINFDDKKILNGALSQKQKSISDR